MLDLYLRHGIWQMPRIYLDFVKIELSISVEDYFGPAARILYFFLILSIYFDIGRIAIILLSPSISQRLRALAFDTERLNWDWNGEQANDDY